MTHNEIREKFLKFFESKGHTIVPSSSLLPDDPSVLFTTAGMQPMIPYLLGKVAPSEKRLADSQKCFRTQDIEEVGDNRHTTFFEMLGNWSFGDYWKKEQLSWIFAFLKDEIKLDVNNLHVTVFEGNDQIPRDEESAAIWKTVLPESHIFYYGVEKNWWSRSGTPNKMPAGEPGGPDSEMFYDFGDTGQHYAIKYGPTCHVNCDCGRYLEIGNNVFMEYQKQADGSFTKLPQRNVDFGGGLERMTAAVNNDPDIFHTSVFSSIMRHLGVGQLSERHQRIIADHVRASGYIIQEGILPSNKDRGYILRRLLRRIIAINHLTGRAVNVKELYRELPELDLQKIEAVFVAELEKFDKTLDRGIKELKKIKNVDAAIAFKLFESYGLPYEVIKELSGSTAQSLTPETFEEEFKKHQAKSREGSIKKFGGHGLLLDTGELKAANEEELKKVMRLHTATHILQAALRKVLGDDVHQAGSDITAERLRFDFAFSRKMTFEELQGVERIINEKIKEDLKVSYIEIPIEEAKKTGALYFFKEKYPEKVKVYSVGNFSKEFCGGPHVSHTAEIGQLKITKEEAVSTGTRRIRAVVL